MGIAEDDGLTDAMWGSQAGFGQLVHGHAFNIPSVPNVSFGNQLFLLVAIYLTEYYTSYDSPQRS